MKLNPEYEVGDVVELHAVAGGYPLPDGVGEGFQVRVVAIEAAYRVVERDGREWRVFTGNIRPRPTRRPVGPAVPAPGRCRR